MDMDIRVEHPGWRSVIQVIGDVDRVDARERVERFIARG